ncbi:MAG: DedA family protein [Bdellovibrionales bacterium]|jgi:membrane-associated protein|nr:DedA family protein [Bdellovibrionales bacterium]MBT3524994.1 DedA family protein [Bdellovibrionales bacterium]MBT7670299.1 DedA family protein [Bdellovibrionales bacterium]MBT7766211.1 DedA family protein [Bdellovibrionales bacterium]
MEELIHYATENVHLAPYIICGALLLAGFNLPVSEDLMLFISAILAREHEDLAPQLFIGVFVGAYFSDLICYWLGRTVGRKLLTFRFFATMATPQRIETIGNYYQKYGAITLILGRFIPFGVRNALFLTAGISRMNFLKFSLSDLLACTISSITFFYLYFTFGKEVVGYIRQGNYLIFGVALVVIIVLIFNRKKRAV